MPGKRPPGPVYRPDDNEGDDVPATTETDHLLARWQVLQDGAALGAMLTHVARHGTMADLATALSALDRPQLEAAAFAMVLIHAENEPEGDARG